MSVARMDGVPARAGRREWIGLGVLALACVLYTMDLTVLHLAVPSLTQDLRPSSEQLLWITDVYGFLVAGSAEAARDTLGGALAMAQELPGRAAAELVTAAHTAFTDGFRLTAAIGAALMFGIAAAATTLLRDAGGTGAIEDEPALVGAPALAAQVACDE